MQLATTQCAKGAERKCQRLAEEGLQESTERCFGSYGEPLDMMTSFKYLVLVIAEGGDDQPAVVRNFRKAWKIWAWLTSILGR